jgi:multicomponent Na+:H+ antiporter subunit B
MKSIIFRTVAPFLAGLMMLFSIFVLLRGHNEPGGGFIGGLIAVSALAIYGIAHGVETVAGLVSLFARVPFMTGLWIYPSFLGVEVPLSTVMLFDTGVYLVVVGAISSIALSLEERGGA